MDKTLTYTIRQGQSEPRSNGNEVIHTPQSTRNGTSEMDAGDTAGVIKGLPTDQYNRYREHNITIGQSKFSDI